MRRLSCCAKGQISAWFAGIPLGVEKVGQWQWEREAEQTLATPASLHALIEDQVHNALHECKTLTALKEK